MSLIQTKNIV